MGKIVGNMGKRGKIGGKEGCENLKRGAASVGAGEKEGR